MSRWPAQSTEQRVWSKVQKTESCWLWHGAINAHGYGNFAVREGPNRNLKTVLAHRFALTLHGVDIPSGMQVCHRCDVRNCVNPVHLFLGSNADNIRDMVAKGRSGQRVDLSKCARGHRTQPSDWYTKTVSLADGRTRVRSKCRICAREQERRRWKSQRDALVVA